MKRSKADTAEARRRTVEIASKALRSQGTNMTGENAEWACRDRVDSTTVRRFVTVHNLDLFTESAPVSAPPGFDYRRDFIGRDEELALVAEIEQLDLTPYEFRGVEARRRVISFGFRQDYKTRRLEQSASIPPFLETLKSRVAAFCGVPGEDFQQVLVIEYRPGVPIGWHKDREHYDRVVGLSLLSEATFRFRREVEGRWLRRSVDLEPRSLYQLTGPARHLWQHSIPPVPALRYSVTFRTMNCAWLQPNRRTGRGGAGYRPILLFQ